MFCEGCDLPQAGFKTISYASTQYPECRPLHGLGSVGHKPQVLIMGQPGTRIELTITFEAGRRHLPVVTLRRVA
jgi:hypothetical protein